MEIERKFRIRQLPEDLSSFPIREIEQGYLATDPTIRIRRDHDEYYLTYKGKGILAHEEYNLPLTEASYEHLLPKCDGTILSKTRYNLPIEDPRFEDGYDPAADTEIPEDFQGLVIELDVFHDRYSGLMFAEVEFPTVAMAKAFLMPDWFLEDVTSDRRFSNAFLSKADPEKTVRELMQ